MPLEYKIKIQGNQLPQTRIEQKDGEIRRAALAAQKQAEIELDSYLRSVAPTPRDSSEPQGHGVNVKSTGTERFAGSFKGGTRASLRTMRLEVSLDRDTVADYLEHGTGIDHYPDPHQGYFIYAGEHKLGPWEHRDIGVHGQIYSRDRINNNPKSGNFDQVWAGSVFIPGTRPHPWVQDAFDDIRDQIEELYHDYVDRAV